MIITLILLLVTLGFVIWPAFSHRNLKISRKAENLRLYEQRKQEIFEAGYADSEREQMLLELDYELVSSEADEKSVGDVSSKIKLMTAFGLFAVMVSSVLFLYQNMGAENEIVATELLNKLNNAKLNDKEQQVLKDSLRKASINNPEHGEWNYLYARMLFSDGQYEESIAIFEKILSTLPLEAKSDRAATLIQIAQGKLYISNQIATQEVYDIVEQALSMEPGNSQALGLAGVIAFELDRYETALTHWKALWLNVSNSPEVEALEQGIKRIVTRLEAQGKTVDLSWMKRAEVKVRVSISAELKAQLAEDDAVFVMAKAMTGPAMPLAALKLMANDLPQEVVLDDSLGMVPGLTLDQFEEVQIIARVAKGGQPMANSGDFQGVVKPILVKSEQTVELLINQVVE